MFFLEAGWKHQLMKKEEKKERKSKEERWIWANTWNQLWYPSLDKLLILIGYYRVTSGGIVGRTFFMMAWIQLRRIPEVMADRVHAPSLHWKQKDTLCLYNQDSQDPNLINQLTDDTLHAINLILAYKQWPLVDIWSFVQGIVGNALWQGAS